MELRLVYGLGGGSIVRQGGVGDKSTQVPDRFVPGSEQLPLLYPMIARCVRSQFRD